MRIGIDCRSLQESEPSGVSVYTRETLRALIRLPEAAQHQFICFANGFRLTTNTQWQNQLKELSELNVTWRVRSFPNKLLTSCEVLTGRPGLQWMFGDVDVVFVPNMQFFPLRDRSIPFVLTVHDLSFERYPECLDLKGRLRHRLVQPRRFIHSASRIMSVSQQTKADLEALYHVEPNRVTTVYPGIASDICTESSPRTLQLPEQYIAFVSTIEPRKNVEALLQAFELIRHDHPKLELVIVGRRGWKSKKVIDRIRHTAQVRYMGYMNEMQKHEVIAHAAAFIYPSLYEGFGFPPLEAQQHGVPVVCGSHSSLPEVVGDSALLVNVLDARSIARGIHALLSEPNLRAQYIRKGIVNASRFEWTKSARNVLNVLTSV